MITQFEKTNACVCFPRQRSTLLAQPVLFRRIPSRLPDILDRVVRHDPRRLSVFVLVKHNVPFLLNEQALREGAVKSV